MWEPGKQSDKLINGLYFLMSGQVLLLITILGRNTILTHPKFVGYAVVGYSLITSNPGEIGFAQSPCYIFTKILTLFTL